MSDHPICRGQFQLYIHLHHRYVSWPPPTPRPSPVCSKYRPACVHPNRTLLNVDVSSSSWLMFNTFHVFMSLLARVVLSIFQALFSFLSPCLFLHPLPRPHSSHSAHRRSTHPHSYLFLPSLRSQKKSWLLWHALLFLFRPSHLFASTKTDSNAGLATFCLFIWVLYMVKTSAEAVINTPNLKTLNLLLVYWL